MVYLGTIQELQKRQQEALTQTRQGLQQKRQAEQPEQQYGLGGIGKGIMDFGGQLIKGMVYDPFIKPVALGLEGLEGIYAQTQRPGGLFGEDYYNQLVQSAANKQRTGEALTGEETKAMQYEKYISGRISPEGELQARYLSQEDFAPWNQNIGEAALKQFATSIGGVMSLGAGGLTTGGARALGGTAGKTILPRLAANVAVPGALYGYGSTAPGTSLEGNLLATGGGALTALGAYGIGSAIGKGIGKITSKIGPKVSGKMAKLTGGFDDVEKLRQDVGTRYGYATRMKELDDVLAKGDYGKSVKLSQVKTLPTGTMRSEANPLGLDIKRSARQMYDLEETTNKFFNVIDEPVTTDKPLSELSKKAGGIYEKLFGNRKLKTTGAIMNLADELPDTILPTDKQLFINRLNSEFAKNLKIKGDIRAEKILPKYFKKLNTRIDDAFDSQNPLRKLLELKDEMTDIVGKTYEKGKPSLAPDSDQIEISVERALREFLGEKAPTPLMEMYDQASAINAVVKDKGFKRDLAKELKMPTKPTEKATETVVFKTRDDVLQERQMLQEKWEKALQGEIKEQKVKLPFGMEYDPRTGKKVAGKLGQIGGVATKGLKIPAGVIKEGGKRMIPPAIGGSYIKTMPNIYDQQTTELDQLEQMLNQPNIDYNTYEQILKQWSDINNTQADIAEVAMEEQQGTQINAQDLLQEYTQLGGDTTGFQDMTNEFTIE